MNSSLPKNTVLKNTFAMALLLGLCSHASTTLAVIKNGSLGNASGATDYYQVTCSKNANGDTHHLSLKLLDLLPVAAPKVSAQVIKGRFAANTTDAVDGDAVTSPAANPWTTIIVNKVPTKVFNSGNGVYDVRVNKTSAGVESYQLNYNCLNSAGKTTGIATKFLQNQ